MSMYLGKDVKQIPEFRLTHAPLNPDRSVQRSDFLQEPWLGFGIGQENVDDLIFYLRDNGILGPSPQEDKKTRTMNTLNSILQDNALNT